MPLKLYKYDPSPASRAAMMICDIHKVPVEFIDIDYIEDEHLKPEFAMKNPIKTIPVLEDDDITIHDSHVILTYITEKYGKDDSLYPKDVNKRALVDQKLFFNTLLFTRMRNITLPAIKEKVRKPPVKLLKQLEDLYPVIEEFLTRTKYIAGEDMSVADIAIAATLSTTDIIIPIDEKKYPKISDWLKTMEKQEFYQKHNTPGSEIVKTVLKSCLDL